LQHNFSATSEIISSASTRIYIKAYNISKNAQMHYSTSGASDAPDAPDVLRGTGWNEIYPYILTQYKCFLRPGATMMS